MLTEEEKKEWEAIKNGHKAVDILTEAYQPYVNTEKELKKSLKKYNSVFGKIAIIGDTYIVYSETKSVKRALAKFSSGVSGAVVTGLILIYTGPESGFTSVSIAFIAGDITEKYSEEFFNTIFDYIESKLPKQKGRYNNPIDMFSGFESYLMNGAINRILNGY
ncbi:hypothetical protein CQA53_10010 [Helicobacter didelphidarum]|uniref:Uncharacterized protein n=1 Tax=Helicobacter didelphidarum TaxID=2040648 RepID=A0A3D8I8U2_9HELI|nr:hypothetical protein [Helicobacter didelphidarum]RDU61538.1 hypothetical protein CQA53_10010 [Helicobacter didelphidarum]